MLRASGSRVRSNGTGRTSLVVVLSWIWLYVVRLWACPRAGRADTTQLNAEMLTQNRRDQSVTNPAPSDAEGSTAPPAPTVKADGPKLVRLAFAGSLTCGNAGGPEQ